VTSTKRPYNNAEEIDLPMYHWETIHAAVPSVEIPTNQYFSTPFHNGGNTGGYRPRRLDYPNSERSNNATNLQEAINAQEQFGNEGSHFVTNKMWISK